MAQGPTQRLRIRTSFLLAFIIIIGFGAALCRLSYLQLFMGEELQQKAIAQQLTDTKVNAKRGTIYDANGEVLAQSASVWQVVMAPVNFESDEQRTIVSKGLAEILDLDQQNIFEKTKKKSYYVVVKRRIDSEQRKQIIEFSEKIYKENGIEGVISLLDDYKRFYPHNELASNILGFTGSDDQGLSGIEYQYDDYLTGKAGRIVSAQTANGTDMPFQYQDNIDSQDGNSLKLTIDARIQGICEKYMAQGIIDNKVMNKGVCIAMNPKTGAIYAMVTANGFNLNEPFTLPKEKQAEIDKLPKEQQDKAFNEAVSAMWRNKAISDIYYPGSVFKMVTASMALEEGTKNLNSTFYCSGGTTVYGQYIGCHLDGGHGAENFKQAIWNSCNPAFIDIGQSVGAEKFWEYYQAFGFSEKTGIDLPGEADDMFFSEDGTMGPVDLAVASFGQNFGITPIQMITAMCTVANGGNLVQPYIVQQIVDSNGNVVKNTEPKIKRQVISDWVSETMCDILEDNAISGGAKNGYVAGYRIAGKTGTTQKIVQAGKYIASFGGFAPADDAQIAMLILFDTPEGDSYYGSQVSAPVFANIMSEVLPYLDMETQYTEEELGKIDITAESFFGYTVEQAKSKAEQAGLNAVIKGDGEKVIAQIPQTGSKIPTGGTIVLYTDSESESDTVEVPDLVGYDPDEVNEIALSYDLNVSVTGSFTADGCISDGQSIEAGTAVKPGTVITVNFITTGTND